MKDFDEKIVEIVQQRWNKEKKATPLTFLGGVLRKLFDVDAELRGAKLLPYLQFNLDGRLDVVQRPGEQLTWGVVPKNCAEGLAPAEVSELFSRTTPTANVNSGSDVNFHRTVWAAFSKPLAHGHVRAIKISDPKQFGDYGPNATIPDDYIPIGRFGSALVGISDALSDARFIRSQIMAWVEENKLAPQQVVFDSATVRQKSMLNRLIEMLDDEELRATQLPLSVVKKLMH